MECRKAISMMHHYFDGDLDTEGQLELREHLHACPACKKRFYQLEKTEALIRALPPIRSPESVDDRIMSAVPKPKRTHAWLYWTRRHPVLSAAIVFIIILIGSLLSLQERDGQLVVRGHDLDQLIIEGDKVIVPESRVMRGNLVVENGEIHVDGEIQGSLVVIDGSVHLASTAKITGEVTRINQVIDRIWYRASRWISKWSPSTSAPPAQGGLHLFVG